MTENSNDQAKAPAATASEPTASDATPPPAQKTSSSEHEQSIHASKQLHMQRFQPQRNNTIPHPQNQPSDSDHPSASSVLEHRREPRDVELEDKLQELREMIEVQKAGVRGLEEHNESMAEAVRRYDIEISGEAADRASDMTMSPSFDLRSERRGRYYGRE